MRNNIGEAVVQIEIKIIDVLKIGVSIDGKCLRACKGDMRNGGISRRGLVWPLVSVSPVSPRSRTWPDKVPRPSCLIKKLPSYTSSPDSLPDDLTSPRETLPCNSPCHKSKYIHGYEFCPPTKTPDH